MNLTRLTCAVVSLLFAVSVAAAAPPAPMEWKNDPKATDWFHEAKWGVMFHFVSQWMKIDDADQWDKTIKNFDVDGLAQQLHDAGAGYLIITSCHYGFPVVPMTRHKNGTYPSTDLVPRLWAALARKNIRLMLYFPTGMGGSEEGFKRTEATIRELSLRYGDKVSGWWMDNNAVYRVDRQKALAEAAKAGNPKSIVGFSGPRGQQRNSPYEDFTAGNSRPARGAKCHGRYIEGVQWHMLSHLAYSWCTVWHFNDRFGNDAPRFTTEEVANMTASDVANGGVVTWDVPPMPSGLINPAFVEPLKAIGYRVQRTKRNKTPLAKFPTPELPKPYTPPVPPKDATITTLPYSHCRTTAASEHWPPSEQIDRLATSVGTSHNHFYAAMLQFDLSKIDIRKPVVSATLYVHLKKVGLLPIAGAPLTVRRFEQLPSDAHRGWYNFKSSDEGEATADDTHPGTLALDVTEIVNAWLKGFPNCGFRLGSAALGEDYLRFPLTTKDYTAGQYDPKTHPNAPRLVIVQAK